MTEPLGQKVGTPIFISDLSGNSIYRSYDARPAQLNMKLEAVSQQYKPADISFEKIKVESIISIKFKIE